MHNCLSRAQLYTCHEHYEMERLYVASDNVCGESERTCFTHAEIFGKISVAKLKVKLTEISLYRCLYFTVRIRELLINNN